MNRRRIKQRTPTQIFEFLSISQITGISSFSLMKEIGKIPVQPFLQERMDKNFRSPLHMFTQQIVFIQNDTLTKNEVKEFIETKRDMNYWKKRFSEEELEDIMGDFEEISYDGIISQSQILKYLRLQR